MEFFQYAVRDMGDLFVRHLETIDILHRRSNVTLAHIAPIEGEDLALYGGDIALVFLDNLRLERALAVTRHMDGDFTQCGLERLLGIAIALSLESVRAWLA